MTLATEITEGPLAGKTFGQVLTAALLLLLLGAAGKSAQIPLYVWLPDAMAGPTPVSALIHAATMVTAGVYLFCRLSFLLVLSPQAMAAVALIGAATALWAALIAFAQDDIKKVLAYSTVSQLGFMFIGVGTGRLLGRGAAPGHPRLLQGLPLPRGRLGDARQRGRDQHQEAGGAAEGDALDLGHLPHRHGDHHRHRSLRRLLVQGRHPPRRPQLGAAGAGLGRAHRLLGGTGRRAVHRLLHDPPLPPDLRGEAGRRRAHAPRARERLPDGLRAGGAGLPLHRRGRLGASDVPGPAATADRR